MSLRAKHGMRLRKLVAAISEYGQRYDLAQCVLREWVRLIASLAGTCGALTSINERRLARFFATPAGSRWGRRPSETRHSP